MDNIFETIVKAYQTLWHFKDYGNTLEIITPVATVNNMFVSIFITKRGDNYIATDGGWIDAGLYECEINWKANIFNKIGIFYLESFEIQQTQVKDRTFYYKRINQLELLPNIVFIQFVSDRVDMTFRKEAQGYLSREFGVNRFEYDKPLSDNMSIRFNAIERNHKGVNLINFVSGSNSSYYANSLCRSNMNFQLILPLRDKFAIQNTVTLLDDRKRSIIKSPQVQTYYDYLVDNQNDKNKVILWSQKAELAQAI